MQKSFLTLAIVGLSTILVACGGGGSGGGNNHSTNQAKPIQPTPKPVPPLPPQHSEPQSDNGQLPQPPQSNQPELNQPQRAQWTGECHSASFCAPDAEPSSAVTVYDLTLKRNATPQNSTPDKLEKTERQIKLVLGDNKETEYQFTLLGSEDNEVGYYGYRNTVGAPDRRQVEVLYAVNSDFKSENQKPNFTANYKKERGFIYAPIDSSTNSIKNYGDVDLTYTEGKLSGSIYRPHNGNYTKDKIFSIETSKTSDAVIITPLENLQGTIRTGDKAVLNYLFANSTKQKQDHKYFFGSAKTETWTGVLAAEKQEPSTNPKP
ncbi:hypothetical protein [Pasteurella oralis]|uniref:hypothetical protein n=1 Tax=Pasteurella oralis TaxID=1071947 RepID=UPI000C7ACC85|nr:hypothetical protein [Pasteurella oralis]